MTTKVYKKKGEISFSNTFFQEFRWTLAYPGMERDVMEIKSVETEPEMTAVCSV